MTFVFAAAAHMLTPQQHQLLTNYSEEAQPIIDCMTASSLGHLQQEADVRRTYIAEEVTVKPSAPTVYCIRGSTPSDLMPVPHGLQVAGAEVYRLQSGKYSPSSHTDMEESMGVVLTSLKPGGITARVDDVYM